MLGEVFRGTSGDGATCSRNFYKSAIMRMAGLRRDRYQGIRQLDK